MRILIPILIIAAIFTGLQSLFIVKQTEFAIKFRLGEVVRADYEPGLHLKTPFINNVVKFDNRLQLLDMQPEQMNTAEQKVRRCRLLHQMAHRRSARILYFDLGR